MAYFRCEKSTKILKKLLWTNPSPLSSSGFPAQTLSLDLSKYEGVLIESVNNTASTLDGFRMPVYVPKDGIQHYVEAGQPKVVPPASNFVATIYTRLVTVTDTGITFSTGYAGTSSTNNTICMPYRIYGYVYEDDVLYEETVLWTNGASTSSFAAQTVTLSDDISNYKYIKVKYRVSTSNSEISSVIMSVEDLKNTDTFSAAGLTYGSISGNGYKVRDYYCVGSINIAFTAGYQINAVATDNNSCIPTEILGLNKLDGEAIPQAKELLWNNPNPTTRFPAQTLLLDLSKYDAVIIRCSMNTNTNTDTQKPYQLFNYVPKDGVTHSISTITNTASTSNGLWSRKVTVTDTGITFSIAGYPASTLATGSSETYIIPTEIYGLTQYPEEYPQDKRKFILKDGIFQGTQGTDYGILGTLTQSTGYVTISSGNYSTGIAPFISASDRTKYKRVVFDTDSTSGAAIRMYYSSTETGSRTALNNSTWAVNLNTLSDNIFLYFMPSGFNMNYYNIYLE